MDQDLKDFVATAHGLGMKVMFDLVYLHCGPTAPFLSCQHPPHPYRPRPRGRPHQAESPSSPRVRLLFGPFRS